MQLYDKKCLKLRSKLKKLPKRSDYYRFYAIFGCQISDTLACLES